MKRREAKHNWLCNYGVDDLGVYERVIIDRSALSVAVDRLDANYWHAEPFLGQRDLFYVEKKDIAALEDGKAKFRTAFVRHNFWMSKMWAPWTRFSSNFYAWSYKSAFKG